ncbi:MAG: LytR/AlgR family response regulator transcription factor [Janthinobacterium lividum]
MTILILEDEAPAARRLSQFIEQYGWQPATVVLPSVARAAAWLAANPAPDLLFSDIELLDGNVFALYQQVEVRCPVIFTTAYDQFLLPAFQANGIAYLLKPFDYPQLAAALAKYERLRDTLASAAPATFSPTVLQELQAALRQQAAPHYKERFSVRLGSSLYVLAVADVVYFQAEEGVVLAIDRTGARYPLGGTLAELERQLDPARFCRLNRSEVVHIAFVEKVEPYFNNRLAVKLRGNANELVTSTGQTPAFRKWLEG